MRRKVVAVWVSLTILFGSIVIVDVTTDYIPTVRATIIYVNETGSGGAFTSIQDAINAAISGDTVFVYNGTYTENIVVDKTIVLMGLGSGSTIIDGGGSGTVVDITAPYVEFFGFTVQNGGSGNFDAGVWLKSYGISVHDIVAQGTYKDIYVQGSNNTVKNCICRNGGNFGILIRGDWNLIVNCTTNNTGTFGIEIRNGYHNKVKECYSTNNWNGFQILGDEYNSFENCTSYNNGMVGFRFHGGVYNCSIISCTSIGNQVGINLEMSVENNVVTGCLIQNNGNGLTLPTYMTYPSNNNLIYHNNFIGNTNQAVDDYSNYWDNGYPHGGNYWSDYGGVDNFKGINQDIPGSDDIGDTPYAIDSDTQDNYPLMGPYIYKPLENYTILKPGWNLISIPLIQIEQDLTKVLETIDGYYDAVQFYNITDTKDPWKHNKIGKSIGNDLFELNETMSFWIHITQPGDTYFVYNGTTPSSNQTIQLNKGWNMVGYPSLSSYNRTVGLNNLTFNTHVDCIQWNDDGTKTWYFMGPDDSFVPGRGYWIHSKADIEWEVPL